MSSFDIKAWVPPKLIPLLRELGGRSLRFVGGYKTWEQAIKASDGYSHLDILNRVTVATRLVVAGEAAYERDGFTFAEAGYSYSLIAMLMHAALANGGKLDVIDFGGSLGSTYRQCLPLLNTLTGLRWQVIEQVHYVEVGNAEFANVALSFHKSLADVDVSTGTRYVLILSSVLQYLQYPEEELQKLLHNKVSHVVIDRTPVHRGTGHRLCVQHVPPSLYGGSYPCWILSRSELLGLFPSPWKLLAEFSCLDGKWRTNDGLDFEYRGFCFTVD